MFVGGKKLATTASQYEGKIADDDVLTRWKPGRGETVQKNQERGHRRTVRLRRLAVKKTCLEKRDIG